MNDVIYDVNMCTLQRKLVYYISLTLIGTAPCCEKETWKTKETITDVKYSWKLLPMSSYFMLDDICVLVIKYKSTNYLVNVTICDSRGTPSNTTPPPPPPGGPTPTNTNLHMRRYPFMYP